MLSSYQNDFSNFLYHLVNEIYLFLKVILLYASWFFFSELGFLFIISLVRSTLLLHSLVFLDSLILIFSSSLPTYPRFYSYFVFQKKQWQWYKFIFTAFLHKIAGVFSPIPSHQKIKADKISIEHREVKLVFGVRVPQLRQFPRSPGAKEMFVATVLCMLATVLSDVIVIE